MLKPILILILCLLFFKAVTAQNQSTVYYLKKSGKFTVKDSADYLLKMFAPDTNVDKNLFGVREFYLNGKIRLMGNTIDNTANLKFQGPCVTYFPNGNRMKINQYKNGEPIGDEMEFYPNGRLYNIKTYSADKKTLLRQCNDSTGAVLTKNGNGKWITFFDESFGKAYAEGPVIDSLQDGEWRSEWHGKINDSASLSWTYKKGVVIASSANDKNGAEHVFKSNEIVTTAKDDIGRFIAMRVHYPTRARENGTQGTVWVNYIIEKDGTLSNVKVKRGIGDGCDEEAIRVIKDSPFHAPVQLYGISVRVACSVPVSFKLASE